MSDNLHGIYLLMSGRNLILALHHFAAVGRRICANVTIHLGVYNDSLFDCI